MPQYFTVKAAVRESGREFSATVTADSADDVREEFRKRGWLIAHLKPCGPGDGVEWSLNIGDYSISLGKDGENVRCEGKYPEVCQRLMLRLSALVLSHEGRLLINDVECRPRLDDLFNPSAVYTAFDEPASSRQVAYIKSLGLGHLPHAAKWQASWVLDDFEEVRWLGYARFRACFGGKPSDFNAGGERVNHVCRDLLNDEVLLTRCRAAAVWRNCQESLPDPPFGVVRELDELLVDVYPELRMRRRE